MLSHPHARPPAVPVPGYVAALPRAVFLLSAIDAEIWCISDLLDDLATNFQSSSEKKIHRLPLVFNGSPTSLVMALGTAASPTTDSTNGCVVVGTRVFLHDGHPPGGPQDPNSQWHDGPFNQVLNSQLDKAVFNHAADLVRAAKPSSSDLMLAPPLNPVAKPDVVFRYDGTALGSINVTSPAEYAAQDKATLDAYATAGGAPENSVSLETTHGLIRVACGAQFLFISGIVNRVGFAATEMLPRNYAQNFVGAHNAGIVLAKLLLAFDQALS